MEFRFAGHAVARPLDGSERTGRNAGTVCTVTVAVLGGLPFNERLRVDGTPGEIGMFKIQPSIQHSYADTFAGERGSVGSHGAHTPRNGVIDQRRGILRCIVGKPAREI